ncbi:hypothetical protein GOB86_12420 [Acetobacter lambici]|uniref:Uncharacterized protein n=1 Tax=Acetobacter lambici TaxID=1332824 RepID=A0ABT1F2Z5_9PROT|nr:hypothetical protein [Acetobacter lambici]MCP1243563.1 hypothetical protein [Acetobacter lambici]MCP1259566.1 hypothetical protein [Acetobacter lambici]NHO57848.1 hypothetical protein [Acetobacter lambici]
MTATTGSGGLSGPGGWVGLGNQAPGLAEGAGQATAQSRQTAALPSSTALAQAQAEQAEQAEQADVMLTLSKGAQSLLGTALAGSGASASTAQGAEGGNSATAAGMADASAGTVAADTSVGAGSAALMADVMRAADTVLNDPSATSEQKALASQLMQLATGMAGQSTSGGAAGATGGALSLPLLQSLGAQSATTGALGGAVVTTSGLYGLASNTVQDGRRALATALAGMGAAQAEEIVLPGGIVQLAQEAGGVGDSAAVSTQPALLGNALTSGLLPELYEALSNILADKNATAEQKAAATVLLQMLDTSDDTAQMIPQALLNPLLAAALMPALSPSQRGRLVRAALAGEVEDMGRTDEAELPGGAGVSGLRAALRKNAAYLAAVQNPLLTHMLQLTQKQEADVLEAALAGWGSASISREQLMEDAIDVGSILAFSQNLMADSPYMAALASTSLTPILIMSWAALLSGCLPRAYPFVPRVWRRANKKKWRRKKQRQTMDFQNLFFTEDAVEV